MESSQPKSKYQRSLRSLFFGKKKWTFAAGSITRPRSLWKDQEGKGIIIQKQMTIFSFKVFLNFFEFCLFNWKKFSSSLKKNYLIELLTFSNIRKNLSKNYILFWLKEIKDTRSIILLFFNIPFLFSKGISEIFDSIRKKTVYFYRSLIILTLPVLLFSVNTTFVLPNNRNSLSFILPTKEKIFFGGKNSLFLKKLKKIFLHNSLIGGFSQKDAKHLLKQQEFVNIPLHKDVSFKQIPKQISQNLIIFYKSFSIYNKIKINFSKNLQTECNQITKEIKNRFFLKVDFLKNFPGIFFSSIESRDLNEFPFKFKLFLNRDFFVSDILELQNKDDKKEILSFQYYTTWYQKRNRKKHTNFCHILNKEQWIQISRKWSFFYSSKKPFNSFKKNKEYLKEKFELIQKFKLIIENGKNILVLEKNVERPMTNRANFFSIFLKNKDTFICRSYKKSISLKDNNFYFPLNEKNTYLEYFPIFQRNNLNKKESPSVEKINFLYNFSLNLNPDSILFLPEFFFFNQKTNTIANSFQASLSSKKNFYDLSGSPTIQRRSQIQEGKFLRKNFQFDDENLFWTPVFSDRETKILLEKEESKKVSLQRPSFVPQHPPFASRVPDGKTYSGWEDLAGKKNLFQSINIPGVTFSQQDFGLINKKRNKFQSILSSRKFSFLTKYNKWIFTTQWWSFLQKKIINEIELFSENLNFLKQVFFNRLLIWLQLENKKDLLGSRTGQRVSLTDEISIFFFHIPNWQKFLNQKVYFSNQKILYWKHIKLISSVHNSSWIFFVLFFVSSIVYYHWLPMLTGVLYFSLWLDFEKIRDLTYPSWKTFLNVLTYNSLKSPSQQLRLTSYSSKARIFSIYSVIWKKWNEIFFMFNRLNYLTTLDLSRRNKNLVSNSLISRKILQSRYGFWIANQQTENGTRNGMKFFEKNCAKNYRLSSFLQKNTSKSFSLIWLNNLFIYNKVFTSTPFIANSNSYSTSKGKVKPIPLSEPLIHTKRWLFIGSLESGKSFAIKNIAANTNYPLIYISFKYIKNVTADFKYKKIKKQKRWLEQLSERSFYLENIFNLAKMLAPSLFWISDLQDFATKNQIQKKNTKKFDVSFLMATLLKILSTDLVPEGHSHVTFVGSTEYPRLLDPKLISRQRLDLIVNFRTQSFNQRKNLFTSILKKKGFVIEGFRSFYELSCNTSGYTFQDITSLLNETLLVKKTENNTWINSNNIRSAIYRQTSIQSVQYKTVKQDNLYYKIGRSLVQTLLVDPKSILLLSKYEELWKTKFSYLSNTYLEISNKKTTTTEFLFLIQILNCLSGSAARDAWLFSAKDSKNVSLSLTNQLKQDLSIASNILQALFLEFPRRDFLDYSDSKKKDHEQISKNFHFYFIKRALSYVEFFHQFPRYIKWSIKQKRISFNWILLFSGFDHSTKNLGRFLFLEKNKKISSSSIFEKTFDINIPYERKETKRQQQRIQKIDSLFKKMIYHLYIENLGFPWESEYIMNYNPFQFSLFLGETRPLWIPQTSFGPSFSILFFDRDLLINQKFLTKLYITYGSQFQNEKLNRKRIKKNFLWLTSSINKSDLEKNSEFQKDFFNSQNQDFSFYQDLINLNAHLDQAQLQFPFYLHESLMTTDPNDIIRNFDRIYTTVLFNNENFISKESFLFEILLEIYQYLIDFFVKNKKLMFRIKELLIKNEILYREDIEMLMKKTINEHFSFQKK